MRVIATAGHVDHGKSTLVRALTGMEPDRWAEERRRGMTIDLGYAWTELPELPQLSELPELPELRELPALASGEVLAFVDVPGHQRFTSNMLAGVGPAPAVLFVVAADAGWGRQSAEHLAAIDALGIETGLLAVTRCDLADPEPAMAEALDQLRRSSLGAVEAVAVSGRTGQGLDELRSALARTVKQLPAPDGQAPVRLWVDRTFAIAGSGTVITATLGAGVVRLGDTLDLHGRLVTVRGLQSLGRDVAQAEAVARVALNLRGVALSDVRRGDTLLSPGQWSAVAEFDAIVRHIEAPGAGTAASAVPRGGQRLSGEFTLHVGSAAVPAQVRLLDGELARVRLSRPLPLRRGDRAVVRDPGRQQVVAGLRILDVDPPALSRRGAAKARAAQLKAQLTAESTESGGPSAASVLAVEVARRGAVRRADLQRLGVEVADSSQVRAIGEWLVDPARWQSWIEAATSEITRYTQEHPLETGLPTGALRWALAIPAPELVAALLADPAMRATVVSVGGRLAPVGHRVSLGAAEPALAALESRLRQSPFAAPEANELRALGLGSAQLAAAVKVGRLLRLPADVVLLADAPAMAVKRLGALAQPFSASQARIALDTTRRVAIPLLEHLDQLGLTERLDGTLRRLVPPPAS